MAAYKLIGLLLFLAWFNPIMVKAQQWGRSPYRHSLIDQLVKTKKLNTSDLPGKWETFSIQTINKPFSNIDQALVIVGSDKCGTIFGAYDVYSQIGVSPWYWWADVPVKSKSALYVIGA